MTQATVGSQYSPWGWTGLEKAVLGTRMGCPWRLKQASPTAVQGKSNTMFLPTSLSLGGDQDPEVQTYQHAAGRGRWESQDSASQTDEKDGTDTARASQQELLVQVPSPTPSTDTGYLLSERTLSKYRMSKGTNDKKYSGRIAKAQALEL